jgi:hypothetical protein
MSTISNTNPLFVKDMLQAYGLRYAFWFLHHKMGLSALQSVYLMLVAI